MNYSKEGKNLLLIKQVLLLQCCYSNFSGMPKGGKFNTTKFINMISEIETENRNPPCERERERKI